MLHNVPVYNVDYTYESKTNHARSTLDHFMVSHNLHTEVVNVICDHNVDNISDHSPVSAIFNAGVERTQTSRHYEDKVLWSSATDEDITEYKDALDRELIKCNVPIEAVY